MGRLASRREVLRGSACLALGAGLLPQTGPRSPFPSAPEGPAPAPAAPARAFAPVRVSDDRIIRTDVGLRPFRPSGFLVRAEKLGSKTVVHNYGHGGGGVTLSWGTSELAVEEAWKSGARRFAVLGCGAVGLASARLLLRRGAEVTIYARDLPPHTTSNVAGAQWSPYSVVDRSRRTSEAGALLARAARLSHRAFQRLPQEEYGISWVENYELSDHPLGSSWETRLTPELYPETRALAPDEHPFAARHVRRYTTMLVEPPVYMEALLRDVRLSGARIVVRELASREEVAALPEPAVVNCTGLGARDLFGDAELMPIKGQLTVLLPQPEVDYIVHASPLYMFPRRDGVLLGGTYERGVETLEVNEAARRRVVAGHRNVFQAMRAEPDGPESRPPVEDTFR